MIKKTMRLAVVLLLGGMTQIWASCPLGVLNPEINPKPLTYNGLGAITFSIFEDAGVDVPALDTHGDPTCEFNVDLSYVEMKDQAVASVTGDILTYFDVTYTLDGTNNRLHFVQKALFPADHTSDADLAIDVIKQSTPDQKYNGFQLNIIGSVIEGSQFTYTISAPEAVEDNVTTPEDKPIDISVLLNDTDPDGNPLSVESCTTPANGTIAINAGVVTYTPNANYNGTDTFECTITDGTLTDTAPVNVIITPANDAPVAVDDSNTTPEDTPIDIDVLPNDSDVDGDTLNVKAGSLTTPTHGTVSINADGTIKYTPDADYTGTDTFDYTVEDGNGGEDTATVTVTITPANDAPVAVDDNDTTDMNVAKTLTPADIVLPNDTDVDGDTLTISSVSNPIHGTVVLNGDGTVTFTPEQNYTGTGTFDYTISDGHGGTDTATVTIIIEGALPDYEVTLSVSQTVFINDAGTFNAIIRITEQLHGINTGDIVYSISKNNKMTLSYDSVLNFMDGKNLSNSDWEWTETASTYRLRYIGTGTIFPAFERMYIGIVGTFTPPADAKGKFPLTIKLRDGSGDTVPTNNEDSETINYQNNN